MLNAYPIKQFMSKGFQGNRGCLEVFTCDYVCEEWDGGVVGVSWRRTGVVRQVCVGLEREREGKRKR